MRAGGAMRRHRYPGVGPAHEAGYTTVALDVGAAGDVAPRWRCCDEIW